MEIELVEADRPEDDQLPPPRTEGERIAFWWQKVPGTPSMYDLAKRIDQAIQQERDGILHECRKAEAYHRKVDETEAARAVNFIAAVIAEGLDKLKLRKAPEDAWSELRDAQDRATWERLKKKYGTTPPG